MKKLENKITLITGASSGIGEACAHQFAAEGSTLILTARNDEKLQRLAANLCEKYGINVYAGQLDVRDYDAVVKFYNELPEELQQIDILINNAGLARGMEPVQGLSVDAYNEMIDTNVKGLLYVTKVFVQGMMQKKGGHIINLGSLAGHEVYPKGAVYCATKFAVNALSKGLRFDLLEYGIKVTSIDPGLVETNFSVIRFDGDVEKAKAVYKGIDPLVAEDIADIILYTATRKSHVNINEVIVTPVAQGSATNVFRK
ncbi:MAG: SDR family NAD(P)-dependent oxidoreductase [Ignavibacteria bacterium]|nr:SDR family NAD(P)-dependent oxidoreductase [Ignavibacteria bacterium]